MPRDQLLRAGCPHRRRWPRAPSGAARRERSAAFVAETYPPAREAAEVASVFGRLATTTGGASGVVRLGPLVRPYRRWRVAAVRAKGAVTVLFERR